MAQTFGSLSNQIKSNIFDKQKQNKETDKNGKKTATCIKQTV